MEFEIYNPNNKPLEELPYIYGFNNGGTSGFMHAQLITQDGADAGSHLCSHEGFMPGDLGCLKGTRVDRHEGFKKTYPNGYQMEFVSSSVMDNHERFQTALKLAISKQDKEETIDAAHAEINIEFSREAK